METFKVVRLYNENGKRASRVEEARVADLFGGVEHRGGGGELADDLFEDVLQGDNAGRAAVFVDDHGKVHFNVNEETRRWIEHFWDRRVDTTGLLEEIAATIRRAA